MNSIFSKFFFFIFSFFSLVFFAQNYPEGVSEGILKINSDKVPVKIFSSTNYQTFKSFPEKNINNTLVIINSEIMEKGDTDKNIFTESLITAYKDKNYQFLDKNFKPSDVEIDPEMC